VVAAVARATRDGATLVVYAVDAAKPLVLTPA
jgi:hypothetical protein